MWTREYQHKNVSGLIVSSGLGSEGELIGFDVGSAEVRDLILRRDPAVLDFLVDAVKNVRDISDLAWSDEEYFVERILPERYRDDLDAFKERLEHLISIAQLYRSTENAVNNLQDQLEWIENQKLRAILRARGKITRRDFRKDYNSLFMLLGKRDGFQCVVCGVTKDLSIDHKIPVINGGTNDLNNLQIMCRSHNSQKGSR